MHGYIAYLKTFMSEEDLTYYFELPIIIAFHRQQNINERTWCIKYIEARKTNPNLDKETVISVFHYYVDMKCDVIESIEMFMQHVKTLNNSKIHRVWDEWEMISETFTSMAQWLPNEMVEDVVGMTRQPAHPSTYNHSNYGVGVDTV